MKNGLLHLTLFFREGKKSTCLRLTEQSPELLIQLCMTGLEQVGPTSGSPLSCQNSAPRAAALCPLPRCRAGHGKAQVCQVQCVLVLAFHDGEAQSVRPLPGGMRPLWPRKFPGGGGERFRILNKGFDFIISSSFKCSDTWKCTSCLRSTERPTTVSMSSSGAWLPGRSPTWWKSGTG